MNKYLAAMVTQDEKVLEDLGDLMKLFPDWELNVYSTLDKVWMAYLQKEPNLVIVDMDHVDRKETNDRESSEMVRNGQIAPILVFISSESSSSWDATFAVEMNALEFMQKPINLDRMIFVLSIAQGSEAE